tara:strand:+ start:196 stop:1491 length:1296 start_codon:yes stop_codon:yes gene_type:complete
MGIPYKTVAFKTLGCKLNYTETSTLQRSFVDYGYCVVDFDETADFYVINSCSVTDNADKKARKIIRKALKQSPNAKIIMIGCYAQLASEEIINIPGVSLVVGAEEKLNLPKHLNTIDSEVESKMITSEIENVNAFVPSFSIGERTRAFLKVQDGCDYNCSFCTIPLARGRSRSPKIEDILLQVEEIISLGALEIVLTGINIGDFGSYGNENLFELLMSLDSIKGMHRYRISSIEPNLLSDKIINFIANSDKFLPHFHIPLQSGSDQILKLMRRRYDKKLFQGRIDLIKSILPDACIGVDVIVGFPGEDEIHFLQTYDFINEIDISYLHVFSYSERANVNSVSLFPKVDICDIVKRSKRMHALSVIKKNKFYAQNHRRKKNILIESHNDGYLSGFSDNYIKVQIKGQADEVNKFIPLQLNHHGNDIMFGERL